MNKLIELINRFHQEEGDIEENREKLYIREAMSLEACPKPYREEYCKEKGYVVTDNPETLINWLREVDKRKRKRFKITKEGKKENIASILFNTEIFILDKIDTEKRYRFTTIIEEL